MIYELMNKIPRDSSFLTSEDVLTGTIFGNLRYFHNQSILIKFLNEATDIFGNNLKINLDDLFKIYFWKKFYHLKDKSKYSEPDLLLCNDYYDIIIECKYYSLLSENNSEFIDNDENYNNQLLRYSRIIEKSNKTKIIIFLTNDSVIPTEIMNKTISKLDSSIQLLWLSWKSLYRILKYSKSNCINIGEKILRKDILRFLKKRGITLFCGFTKRNINIKWKYKKIFTYGTKCNYQTWEYKE
jgi:hypothetical protein